jgi:hypothetical protein
MGSARRKSLIREKKGQTFVEFLFLFLSIMGLSYLLLGGIGKGIGARWVQLVEAITAPTNDPIKIQ